MPTIDLSVLGGMLANLGVSLLSYAGIAAILYNIGKLLIRTISWTLDNLLISFIGKFYDYLQQILNGTIFSDAIVKEMMNRVYLIIGVIILFRLGMLFVQYIVNPAQVLEEKGGINSLVKRAIIGLCLMIFIPTIFNIANDLQVAILKDQIIEKIVMDEATFNKVQERGKKYGMGRVIGMTIFQGFWNVDKNQIVDKNIIRAYEEAEKKYDPGLVEEAGYGILTESGGKYAFDYFPVLSTAVLAYVLYLMIKYCIDMVLKSFKLLILQIIAPITIVEYIVNGDRNEVFQKWRRSVVANYAMLFVRVFTIWFVAYVSLLMDPKVTGSSATLLNTQDYLLKAIIVLALLAFMMDFPKMLSDIFGLDLEQDSSVKNVLGKAMGVATAGLAIGGAAAGFGLKTAHGISGASKQGIGNFAASKGKNGFAQGIKNPKGVLKNALASSSLGTKLANSNVGGLAASIGATAKEEHLGKKIAKGAGAVAAAALNSNKITQSAYGGYSGVDKAVKGVDEKAEADAKATAAERDRLREIATAQVSNNPGATKSDIIDSMLNTEIKAKLNFEDIGEITKNIVSRVQTDNSSETLYQTVHQVLGNKIGVSGTETEQIVNQVLGDSEVATPAQTEQVVNQVIQKAKEHRKKEITLVVNQVMGDTSDTALNTTHEVDVNVHTSNDAIDDSSITDEASTSGKSNSNAEYTKNVDNNSETLF